MENINENIQWHIFVELNCAPKDDSAYSHVSTIDQVLKSLPVIKHYSKLVFSTTILCLHLLQITVIFPWPNLNALFSHLPLIAITKHLSHKSSLFNPIM